MSLWLPDQEDSASGSTLAASGSPGVAGENRQLCPWHMLKRGLEGWEDWKEGLLLLL